MLKTTFLRAALTAAALLVTAVAQPRSPGRATLVISVDGLCPDYLINADKHGLKVPNLRRLMKKGIQAAAVRGVLPTLTYPSHTTLLTGVYPARHGIVSNGPFNPEGRNSSKWFAYAEDIRVPTLWTAAARAGYIVGSISWPVSVGARDIHVNIPEFAPFRTDEDLKLVRALSNGLLDELAPRAGPYVTDVNQAVPRDWARTRYGVELIRGKGVRFATVHLAALDHDQHVHGPFTPGAYATLEEIDRMIGVLDEAMRAADPEAAVCVLSDHGFARVEHLFDLKQALVRAGLMPGKPGGAEWTAMSWGGPAAAIMMKDPKDEAARAKVKRALDDLAADPANGIAGILDSASIAKLGGTPAAAFWVDMRPGFGLGTATNGALVMPVSTLGAHGYSPAHREMNSVFIIAGRGIRAGGNLGVIDMRSIAPTLAKVMGVAFTTADAPALDVASPAAP